MDKIKFESALIKYAEALIKEKGRTPEYGGYRALIESEDIRVIRLPHTLELQVGHLFFRYHFRLKDELSYDFNCKLSEVRIADFDACYESGELANIGKIRNELKELEKQA